MGTDKSGKKHAMRSRSDLLQGAGKRERFRKDRDAEWRGGICQPSDRRRKNAIRLHPTFCNVRKGEEIMFEQSKYGHSSGKQQIRAPNVQPGNMNAFIYSGNKRKRRVIKRGK